MLLHIWYATNLKYLNGARNIMNNIDLGKNSK